MTTKRDQIADVVNVAIVLEGVQHWLELHDRAVAHRVVERWRRLSNTVSGPTTGDIAAAWSAFTRETEEQESAIYEQIVDQYARALKPFDQEPLLQDEHLDGLALSGAQTRAIGPRVPSSQQELERAAALYGAEVQIRWSVAISGLCAQLARTPALFRGSSRPGRSEAQP